MSEALLSTARASLEEERTNLRRQLAELTGMELDHNFADASSVAAEQGEVRVLAENLRALLRAFGKGRKERIVPLGRAARRALEEWYDRGRPRLTPEQWAKRTDAEAVFLNRRGGRLTRQGAWLVVKQRAGAVGLGDVVWPHVLRHSCATHMLDRGADIRAVQELLGHASITTTQVYTKVSTERLRAVYDAAHPRARRR